MTEILLKAEGLVAGYTAEVDILNGVDMEVRRGDNLETIEVKLAEWPKDQLPPAPPMPPKLPPKK